MLISLKRLFLWVLLCFLGSISNLWSFQSNIDLHPHHQLLSLPFYTEITSYPEQSIKEITDNWEKAKKINDTLTLARSEEQLGRIYFNLKDFSHTLSYYQKSVDRYKSLQLTLAAAKVDCLIAEVFNIQNRPTEAWDILYNVKLIFSRFDEELWLSITDLQLGNMHAQLHNTSQAVKHYDLAIQGFEKNDPKSTYLLSAYKAKEALLSAWFIKGNHLEVQFIYDWGGRIALLISLLISLITFFVFKKRQQYQNRFNTQIQEKSRELQTTNERLAEANRELKRFAYISSHDFKEPLRNIASFTTLIKRRLANHLDQDTEEYFQFVANSTRQISQLVTDIFEYSKIDADEITFSYLDLNEVLHKSLHPLKALVLDKNAKVQFDNLPTIYSNGSYLQLMFKNLIENGLMYNQSSQPTVQVSCEETINWFQFSVSDNGVGISNQYHDYIFEMFRRLQDRQKSQGSGLGLAICKKIVRQLNGEISLQSEEGKGTTFLIRLPKTAHQNNFSNPESNSINSTIGFQSLFTKSLIG